jgi:hypothetical protein
MQSSHSLDRVDLHAVYHAAALPCNEYCAPMGHSITLAAAQGTAANLLNGIW